MDIVPSKRLGPFVLGMPVGQTLEYLQEHEREISSVQVWGLLVLLRVDGCFF